MKIKTLKLIFVALLIIPILVSATILLNNSNVFASDVTIGLQKGAAKAHQNTDGSDNGTPSNLFGSNSVVKNIVNTLLYIVGAVSVLMLIYGGIRYTISGGDEKSITAAKNTILYSVIGLVVAIAAYAVVNWVVGIFSVPTATSATMVQTRQTPQQAIDAINQEFKSVTSGNSVVGYAIDNFVIPLFAAPATENTVASETTTTTEPTTSGSDPTNVVDPIAEITPEPATPDAAIESPDTSDGDNLTSEEFTAVETEVSTARAASAAEEGITALSAQQIRNSKMVANAENETGKGYGETLALGDNIGRWKDSNNKWQYDRLGEYQKYTGCPGVAWCASFVSFIHHKSTLTPPCAPQNGPCPPYDNGNSLRACGVSDLFAKAGSRLKNYNNGNPIPGDIVGWHTNDLSKGHTGILIKILNNGNYYTVEGNGGSFPSKVKYFSRSSSYWKNSANAHYVRP